MARVSAVVVVFGIFLCACGVDEARTVDGEETGESVGELRTLRAGEIVGSIDFGETRTVLHPGNREYRAFRITVPAQTRLDAWVRSTNGDAKAWILRANFATSVSNDDAAPGTLDSHVVLNAPVAGVYYIAFQESKNRAATFTVSVAATGIDAGVKADAGTRVDAGAPGVDAGAPVGVDAGSAARVIDWCGNGVDEDGLGGDRLCSTGTGLPIEMRQLVLLSASSNSTLGLVGETSVPAWTWQGGTPAAKVAYPRNVMSKVRLENRSPYTVHLTPFPLYPGVWEIIFSPQTATQVDSAVFDVVPGSRYRVTGGAFTLYLDATFSEPQTAAATSQLAILEGTMLDPWNVVTPVRVTVIPEVGATCGSSQQNKVQSINDCAGQTSCLVWSRIVLEKLPASSSDTPSTLAMFLPPQCSPTPAPGQSYPPSWRSALIWENGALAINGSGSWTGGSTGLSLYSDPAIPGHVIGSASGTVGPYYFSSGSSTRFSLHFVANQ